MQNFDTKIFRAINNLAGGPKLFDQIMVFGAKYALVVFALILVVLFFKRKKLFWTALFSALLARGILVEMARYFYDRPRPFVALENVKLLIEKNGGEPSFPSGHTAFIFAVAIASFLFYKKLGVILLLAASILALARIYTGVHYPSDILGGILTAGLAVYMIRKLI